MRIVVVLPAPLGPSRPTISPRPDRAGQAVDGLDRPVPPGEPIDLDHHPPAPRFDRASPGPSRGWVAPSTLPGRDPDEHDRRLAPTSARPARLPRRASDSGLPEGSSGADGTRSLGDDPREARSPGCGRLGDGADCPGKFAAGAPGLGRSSRRLRAIVRSHRDGRSPARRGRRRGRPASARRPSPSPRCARPPGRDRGGDGHVGGAEMPDRTATWPMSANWVTTPGSAIDSSRSPGKVSVELRLELVQLPVVQDQGEDGRLVGVLGVDDDPLADRDPPIARLAARGLLEERADALRGIAADDVGHDEDPVQVRAVEQLADVLADRPRGPSPRDRRLPPPPEGLPVPAPRCVIEAVGRSGSTPSATIVGRPRALRGEAIGPSLATGGRAGSVTVADCRPRASRVAKRSGTPRPRRGRAGRRPREGQRARRTAEPRADLLGQVA